MPVAAPEIEMPAPVPEALKAPEVEVKKPLLSDAAKRTIKIILIATAVIAAAVVAYFALTSFQASPFIAANAQFKDTSIYPTSSTKGTVFTLQTEVLHLASSGESECVSVPAVTAKIGTFDVRMERSKAIDGSEKAGKCLYLGTFDSVQATVGDKHMIIEARDREGNTKQSDSVSFTINELECVTLHQGTGSNPLDIVFLGDKYANAALFEQHAKIHADHLVSVEPFKKNAGKINIHTVLSGAGLDCIESSGTIKCNDEAISRIASICPYEEIIVLMNTPNQAGTANPHAYASAMYPEISLHEFGHSFGPEQINLADQYSYGFPSDGRLKDAPNCAPMGCDKWNDIPGTGCYSTDKYGREGCMYSDWYRPAEYNPEIGESLMEGAELPQRQTLNETTELVTVKFDAPSFAALEKLLEGYA